MKLKGRNNENHLSKLHLPSKLILNESKEKIHKLTTVTLVNAPTSLDTPLDTSLLLFFWPLTTNWGDPHFSVMLNLGPPPTLLPHIVLFLNVH